MDKSLYEFGHEMMRIMPVFFKEFLKKQTRAFSVGQITIPQMGILTILREKGHCKMNEIARFLSVTTSAATGLVERMVKSNLLKRRRDDKDRRIIYIEMTPKGEKIIDDIQKLRYKMIINIFGKLSRLERERYLKTIKKLYRILTEKH